MILLNNYYLFREGAQYICLFTFVKSIIRLWRGDKKDCRLQNEGSLLWSTCHYFACCFASNAHFNTSKSSSGLVRGYNEPDTESAIKSVHLCLKRRKIFMDSGNPREYNYKTHLAMDSWPVTKLLVPFYATACAFCAYVSSYVFQENVFFLGL